MNVWLGWGEDPTSPHAPRPLFVCVQKKAFVAESSEIDIVIIVHACFNLWGRTHYFVVQPYVCPEVRKSRH